MLRDLTRQWLPGNIRRPPNGCAMPRRKYRHSENVILTLVNGCNTFRKQQYHFAVAAAGITERYVHI